jgi:guanosine-3',5'-bis(diphosphate) 3'-pyrophosphohydrolase
MNPSLEPTVPLDLVLMTRVVDFAATKHRGQQRKGVAAEPYFNHLAEVAFLVAKATEGRDPIVVLGALLHDTIEDTKTTADELEAEFGAEVARLVAR